MRITSLIAAILMAPCCTLCGALQVLPALADDIEQTSGPPMVRIHSMGGTVTIFNSGDQSVHIVQGGTKPRVTRFAIDRAEHARIFLPMVQRPVFGRAGWRSVRLPQRQFFVPNLHNGNDGISIDNPAGDISVGIPERVAALYINAEAGDVNIERLRGPYIIVTNDGMVRMRNSAGRGMIRTVSGNIELGGIGGDVHIQTGSGRVTVYGSVANSADVVSQLGAINWRFARVGAGAYRFRSTGAPIHLAFRPGVSALVDAQSNAGIVQNMFDATLGQVRFSSAHAMSIAVNGGGPEISAASMSGDITLEPVEAVATPQANAAATP